MQVITRIILKVSLWAWILPGPFICAPILVNAQDILKVAIFDVPVTHEHAQKVERVMMDELKRVSKGTTKVRLVHYPIYDSKGSLIEQTFKDQLAKALKEKVRVFHFSWNMRYGEKFESIVKVLNKISSDPNHIVIAAAGVNEPPLKLNETVMGKVERAIIVGELLESGYLHARSNYGPELFTALKNTTDLLGSSGTAALFSARLSHSMITDQKFKQDVFASLTQEKIKSKNIHPTLQILFEVK